MKFESFYFYTNQRALKNYLVNYKIEPSVYRNELNNVIGLRAKLFIVLEKRNRG